MQGNLWQQAEENTGALIELERLAERLRNATILAPGEDATPARDSTTRPGIIAMLDSQAGSIAHASEILRVLLDYVGERGQAPVGSAPTRVIGEATRPYPHPNSGSGGAVGSPTRGW